MAKIGNAVTSYQVFALVTGTIIGVAFLVLPRWVIGPAGSGAVVAMLIGSVLACLFAVVWGWVADRYPSGGPEAKTRTKGIGVVAKMLVILIFVGYYIVVAALVAREFGELVVTAILINTPIEVITLLLFALTTYMLRQPVQAMARVFEFVLPLIIFPSLFAVFGLKNARAINLLPFVGNDPSGLVEGSTYALASFVGMIAAVIVVVVPNRPKRLTPPILSGVALSAVLHTFIVGVTLAVFGPVETNSLMWPTLDLARITSVPGNVLERLEAVFLAVWVSAVFTTLAGTLILVVVGLARMFNFSHHRVVVPWVLPILYVIATIPPNILVLYEFIRFWSKVGIGVLVVVPILMYIVYWASPDRRSAQGQSSHEKPQERKPTGPPPTPPTGGGTG